MARKKTNTSVDQGVEAGELWLSNIKGSQPFTSPAITSDTIQQYSENKYIKDGIYKQERILFEDEIEISVFDRKEDKQDDDLTATLEEMCAAPSVDMNDAIRRRWRDVMIWGCSPANIVWGYEGREYRLQKMRLLLPESFNTASYDIPYTAVKNRILPGICYNPDAEEVQLFQRQSDGTVKRLENIDLLVDPINKNEPGGTPFILPLVPMVTMMNFAWTQKMREVNIYGSGGILFIKVTNPTKDDKEYAQKILRNVSGSTRYQLRGNMEAIQLGLNGQGAAMDTITELGMQIRQFFSPSDMLTKGTDQQVIGGSSGPEYQMYMSYIKGTHRWLERSIEYILRNYLVANAYDPKRYIIQVDIPEPVQDETDKIIKLVDTGFKTQSMSTKARMDMLVRAGVDMEVTDEEIAKVQEEFASIGGVAASPMFQKADLMVKALQADKLDPYSIVPKGQAQRFIQKTLGIENGEAA